ncbi:MAG: DUF4114 domain-containing protein [Alphaproteobacteria bacterium]
MEGTNQDPNRKVGTSVVPAGLDSAHADRAPWESQSDGVPSGHEIPVGAIMVAEADGLDSSQGAQGETKDGGPDGPDGLPGDGPWTQGVGENLAILPDGFVPPGLVPPGLNPAGEDTDAGSDQGAGPDDEAEALADIEPAAGGAGGASAANTGASFAPFDPLPLPPGIDHDDPLAPTDSVFSQADVLTAPRLFAGPFAAPLQTESHETIVPPAEETHLAPVVAADGSGQSILVQHLVGEHDPDSQPWIGDHLRSHPGANNTAFVNGVVGTNLTLQGDAHVTVQFESESAGYQNMLGWYKIVDGQPTDPQLIWLNTSQGNENVDGNPLADGQPMTVDLGAVPQGTEIGFFLIADGWGSSANRSLLTGKTLDQINVKLDFADAPDANHNLGLTFDGHNLAGNVYYSNDRLLNPDHIEHTLSGIDQAHAGWLHVGFEDLLGGGDWDYNDVLFRVHLGDYPYDVVTGDSLHGHVTVTDLDSSVLVGAQVAADGLAVSDSLSFDSAFAAAHGITATTVFNGGIVTGFDFAGTAPPADYETLLSSVTIHTDPSSPTPGLRELSFQVTDDTGLASNLGTAHFTVGAEYIGTDHGDLLSGGTAGESLFGLGGIDTISGGDGDDTIDGGAGSDVLTGGNGADTFVIGPSQALGGDVDHVTDFHVGTGPDADRLDVSGVIHMGVGDDVHDFLNAFSDGTNTHIEVRPDGAADGPTGWEEVAVFDHTVVDLATLLANDQVVATN